MRFPTPREEIYRLYWYLASERQAVFARRVAGMPAPWTVDPILRRYKFCNVYRAADRVSQFMIRDVVYGPDEASAADRIFQIVAFRTFSWPETWRGVSRLLGRAPLIRDLADGSLAKSLDEVRRLNGRLYTGAFILCATDAYGGGLKHHNHVGLFHDMFVRRDAADRILKANCLSQVYAILHDYPLMGDFMSYQISIDLNYSSFLNFSENEFTKAGPGALRGLRKAFSSLGDLSPDDTIRWMVDHQQEEFGRYGLLFDGLWGRPLHSIDCQGLFCELDKYCREAAPGLVSGRTRIKARFSQHAESIRLFFPPKWGINDRLPSTPVLGGSVAPSGQTKFFAHHS